MVQVCPPGLHISLGIFWLFTLLEDACHGLDVSIAQYLTPGSAGVSFVQYANALQRQSTLRDDINTVKGQIACLDTMVTVRPCAPQTNAFLQQISGALRTGSGSGSIFHCVLTLHILGLVYILQVIDRAYDSISI